MARTYAAIPHEYIEEMDALSDAEFGRLVRALLKYSMTGETIALNGNERFFAKRVMLQEDKYRQSYDEQAAALTERAKNAAAARWDNAQACESMQKDAQACLSITSNAKNAINKKEKEKEREIENKNNTPLPIGNRGNSKKLPPFIPPSVEEVRDYCRQRGNNIDPEAFVAYYAAQGWKLANGNPMKSWQMSIINWEKMDKQRGKNKEPNPFIRMMEEGLFDEAE